MKRFIKYLLIVVLIAQSCYKDKSSLDVNKLAPVVIDTTGIASTLRVGYMDKFRIEPIITKNGVRNHEDLICEWIINETPKSKDYVKLFDGPVFDSHIEAPIDPSNYIFRLKVTDKEYDYSYFITWKLYITSSIGEGIMVAYTEDNVTSDIALIMDKPISANYTGETSIRKGFVEARNGNKLSSLVESSCYTYRDNLRRSTVWLTMSDGSFETLDCEDYVRNNNEMIYKPDGFKSNRFAKGGQSVCFFTSEGMYRIGMNDHLPTVPFTKKANGGDPSRNMVSADNSSSSNADQIVWYSESKGKFYGMASFMSGSSAAYPDQPTAAFNPGNLPNKECLAAGLSTEKSLHTFLLKDKSSGDFAIYTIQREIINWDDYDNSQFLGAKAKFDIPAAANPIINNAKSIFFMVDAPVMYVATEDAIYTIIFSSSPAYFEQTPRYDAPAGEKISIVKLYQEGYYTSNTSDFEGDYASLEIAPLTNKSVMVATQKSEFEGIVRVIPMQLNMASSGVLEKDPSKHLKYEGFAKILDIISQGINRN